MAFEPISPKKLVYWWNDDDDDKRQTRSPKSKCDKKQTSRSNNKKNRTADPVDIVGTTTTENIQFRFDSSYSRPNSSLSKQKCTLLYVYVCGLWIKTITAKCDYNIIHVDSTE